ncbi:putative snare domain-protein [Podospora aff. communis PSN243]|uniref:Snare domain-protein n=1 Tax=Podospora aff. communis PSN243 TaxID=3040156 RepID=A0AAV9GRE5_9PEZI|nr:putative snare domain-protein [Podospora aff. communis PSN243]
MSYQTNYPAEGHEMQTYSQGRHSALELSDFLARVDSTRIEIRNLAADIQHISNLHHRTLTSTDSNGQAQHQLDQVLALAQQKSTTIREQIRGLKHDAESTPDSGAGNSAFQRKKRQVESLTADFKREVQNLLQERQNYESLCRDQIARQYRIVNPDATDEEVRSAADRNFQEDGIFQTALRANNAKTGQASAVLGAVRARQNEMQKIEQSLSELAQLFQDLDTLVVQDGVVVQRIEEQTRQADEDLSKGIGEITVAQRSALHRRKLKWICFGIVVAIIVLLGLGIGLWQAWLHGKIKF